MLGRGMVANSEASTRRLGLENLRLSARGGSRHLGAQHVYTSKLQSTSQRLTEQGQWPGAR
eukprot:1972231-Pyramimonas_sp.AAC.1